MKIVCVYHSIDLDGWMSAAIVKHWYSKQIFTDNFDPNRGLDFIGYNYGQPIPDLSEYDKIIMCDISFPKEEMSKLWHNLDKELIWIDHHISAIKDNNDLVYKGLRDTNFAACELTWKYFMSNPIEKFGEIEDQEPMPEIVRLLGRYDCFGHKGTDEELKVLEFQYGARQCISNYEEAHDWLHNCVRQEKAGTLENYIWLKGNNIYEYLCTEAKQTYKNGFEIIFKSTPKDETCGAALYKFICINKERFNPINFGIDYHKDGYDGCACFYFDGTHWCFSLYNDNGKVDCSVIAKQFGGGGHKGAAGFRLNNEDFNKLIFNNAPINYCIEVDRRGIAEENCVLHHKFSSPPTKEDIEAYLISEDIGYDSKYCSYHFYEVGKTLKSIL